MNLNSRSNSIIILYIRNFIGNRSQSTNKNLSPSDRYGNALKGATRVSSNCYCKLHMSDYYDSSKLKPQFKRSLNIIIHKENIQKPLFTSCGRPLEIIWSQARWVANGFRSTAAACERRTLMYYSVTLHAAV
jgi:hypothetical protein